MKYELDKSFSEELYDLATKNNFFWENTKLGSEPGDEMENRIDVIIEAMALIYEGDNVEGFNESYLCKDFLVRLQKDKDYDKFFKEIKLIISDLKVFMPKFNKDAMEKTTIPFVIYGAYRTKENFGEAYMMNQYINFLRNLFENYDQIKSDIRYCEPNSLINKKSNVRKRKKFFDGEIDKICK